MEEMNEFERAALQTLVNLNEGYMELKAENAALRMVLGVALANSGAATMVHLRQLHGMAEDFCLPTNMTAQQIDLVKGWVGQFDAHVARSQQAMYPGGLHGVAIAFARWRLNLRRALVGTSWNGGILRGLALRWWTWGATAKPAEYAPLSVEALKKAASR